MSTPFEELGLRAWAEPEEIRSAYRTLVKQCHPDLVQDPAKKQEAQERMIRLNRAYEEALRLATPRQQAAYVQELSKEEAVILAERMLQKGHAESALRQLQRAESRDAAWYSTCGKVLLRMEQYSQAHEAFRTAVRMDPDNKLYRSGALTAAIAQKKQQTISWKIRKAFRKLKRK